jgi:hypothetical protein
MTAKKRRHNSTEADTATTADSQRHAPIQSQDFWFSDGDIVIQAEGTQFLVHSYVLAKNSIKVGKRSTQRQDGSLPTLFFNKKADDVLNLLKALYDWCVFLAKGLFLLTSLLVLVQA